MRIRNGLFIILFILVAMLAMQINLSPVIGKEGQYFTAFQLFGPIAGAFLGLWGILTVFGAQLLDFLVLGKAFTLINVLRLLPMLFAVYFFWRKKSAVVMAIVPLAAMILFWAHPTGSQAWLYPLLWTIPVLALFFKNSLLWRSFGATFTAHAVGSVIWLYTVPMDAGQWVALIPQVLLERSIFALGIAGSYLVANALLDRLTANWKVPILQTEKRAQKS
ncbi:MAG: hypothetical protein V1735_01735 [Nanoarchaeota archaeon]